MSDWDGDEHIIPTREEKLARTGMNKDGLWPHEVKQNKEKKMSEEKKEMIFVNGLIWKQVSEKAPPTVIAKISVKREEFMKWLEEADDNGTGWINVQCNLSQKTQKFYFVQDTYGFDKAKPAPKPVVQEIAEDESLPF